MTGVGWWPGAPASRRPQTYFEPRRREGVCESALAAAVLAAAVALRLVSVLLAAVAAFALVCRVFFAMPITSLRAGLAVKHGAVVSCGGRTAHDATVCALEARPGKAGPPAFSQVRLHAYQAPVTSKVNLCRLDFRWPTCRADCAQLPRRGVRFSAPFARVVSPIHAANSRRLPVVICAQITRGRAR